MRLLIILLLFPTLLFAECYVDEYKTKKGRDKQFQSIVDELSDKFISKVLTPPEAEIKKIKNSDIKTAVKNKFYVPYQIHDEFLGIKLLTDFEEHEVVKYIKTTKSLYRIKDDVWEYSKKFPNSGIKGFDIGFLFEVWSGDLVSMSECAVK